MAYINYTVFYGSLLESISLTWLLRFCYLFRAQKSKTFFYDFHPPTPSPLNLNFKVYATDTLIHLNRKEPVFQYGHDATTTSSELKNPPKNKSYHGQKWDKKIQTDH